MADASVPMSDNSARTYRSLLDEQPLPAAVIDSATAEIVAANAGGRDVFGLAPETHLPAALDRAMPAIAALRDVAQRNPSEPVVKSLTLWQRGAVVVRDCGLLAINAAAPSHVLIVFRPGDELATGQQPAVATPMHRNEPANDDSPGHECGTPATDATDRSVGAAKDVIGEPTLERPPSISLSAAEIAKLAHELKTPLSAIAAAAEIMRDERLGPMGNDKYLNYASDIHLSAMHALSVVTEMLAAGLPRNPNETRREPVDLSELATRTVSALQPLADAKGLKLAVEGEKNLSPLAVNATAIRQILLNLLTNALKFTPSGGEVRVATGYLDNGAQFLAVRDTGEGMDIDAIASALADTGEDDLKRPGGGRGFGLRLVRRLTAENRANFEIDSTPGLGTVVLISFSHR